MCPKSSSNCPVDKDLVLLLEALSQRYSELSDATCQRHIFLNRLRNLARFGAEPNDYQLQEVGELPREVEIALAVCHPECGNLAYVVVEGGPQSCDSCGGTMCPVEIGTYRRKKR